MIATLKNSTQYHVTKFSDEEHKVLSKAVTEWPVTERFPGILFTLSSDLCSFGYFEVISLAISCANIVQAAGDSSRRSYLSCT
jgi:hypothetical protein